MILSIDIGNTLITIGLMNEGKAVFAKQFTGDLKKTDLEYAIDVHRALRENGFSEKDVEDCLVSSVAPSLTAIYLQGLTRLGLSPYVVTASSPHGLEIGLKHPRELGTDLLLGAAAAVHRYGCPVIVLHMNTASSISVVDKNRTYLGGAILPGLQTALDALTNGTAALPQVTVGKEVSPICVKTDDCMRAGAVLGGAGMMDGLLDRILEELREKDGTDPESVPIISTGRFSDYLLPYMKHKVLPDPFLSLQGMALISENRKEGFHDSVN